ncbi:protein kinase [Pyxidicoccus fallax]|uniref:Protein kinase n=2 Tax=Pyxidicoccus fallax TaxID=394095 RepID=A0A848L978_9BACT|nr:serine/threonine-protein kinase [Pyxidicoccus fallax]NMO15389.1 protein kinase [Pyxidicoccus fallax]NPC86042.1 protein kinase [Pyxidicoccus fallax]
MTRPSDGDLRTDTVLRNTYKIVSVLGRGGMGAVYLAQHLRLPGKQVAVKVLRGGDQVTQEIFTRFRREAEIASRLGHPNIVEVLDYDTLEDGTPFLVLEFLRGESLQSRLERGRIPLDEVFSYTRQMGSALQAAHGAGIVHRDLKPANVFLVPTDSGGVVGQRVKLLDFGISKVLTSQTLQTQEATIIGTPQYMSPEQAMGKNREIDARTDIFALGCIVYEMMTGKPVFGMGTLAQMIFRVVYEPADPLAPLCPEAPAQAIAAVERALSKRAEDRFPDVTSFVEALTGSPLHTLSPQSGAQPVPRPTPTPSARPVSGIARPVSGIALPDSATDEGFDATIAPGSVKVAPNTGHMGAVQPEPFANGGTGRMGAVQPEPFANGGTGRMGAPLMDPPGLEPTLISKQVAALPPERPPQPITAVTPPAQAMPQQGAASGQSGAFPPPVAGASVAGVPVQPVAMPPAQAAQPAPAKGRGPLFAAAAVALFVAGGGVVWMLNRPEAPSTAPAGGTQTTAVQQPSPNSGSGLAAVQPPANSGTQTAAVQPPANAGTGTEAQPPADTGTPRATSEPGATNTPTVATTTPDKPTPPRTTPTRPEPREELSERVRELLAEGERALAAGDARRAVELAKSSQRAGLSKAAYSLLTRAYCQSNDLGGARAEWPKVAGSEKARVKKFCQKHDIEF